MSDPAAPAPAPAPVASSEDAEPKLSKNELKRRAKIEAQRKKKEEKAKEKAVKAAAEPKVEKKNVGDDDSDDMNPAEFHKRRVAYCEKKGLDAYPHKFDVSMTLPEYIKKYEHFATNERDLETIVKVTGRIMSKRWSGQKLIFYDLEQMGVKLQILADARNTSDDFVELHSTVKRGDIVGVTGNPGRSKRGELSIMPTGEKSIQILAPCLHMLPHLHLGLANQETKYRRRFLDLMLNPGTKEMVAKRSKIIRLIRRFLEDRDFVEVETPSLNVVASGASARPFETKLNDLNLPMFMRISPELYLKRLVVGGLDRVFDMGKNFRNESIDLTHNPEFTMCEFYWAYADYHDLIDLTKEMISSIVKDVTGGYDIEYHFDANDREKVVKIDFRPENWKEMKMIPSLEAEVEKIKPGWKVPSDLETEEARLFLKKSCEELEVECSEPHTTSRLLDKLVGHLVEPLCINPTFLTEHPRIMSPLAKWHRDDPQRLTERFELFVNGRELCNAYTELNSPFVQRDRFMQQAKVASEDDEMMKYDEDYCTTLEYGLPPTAGWGMGIDRFVMLLVDTVNIKDVILFPAMRPEQKE